MTLREIIEALRTALNTLVGDLPKTRSIAAYDAYANAWQLVGRLSAIEEMQANPGRVPRPIIETIDPDTFAGVEIDPLLTPAQVEAAYHAALADVFDYEDSDEAVKAELDQASAINGELLAACDAFLRSPQDSEEQDAALTAMWKAVATANDDTAMLSMIARNGGGKL